MVLKCTAAGVAVEALSATVLCILLCGRLSAERSANESVEFNRDVRPILSNHCFQCHGPDESAREGDLRLDVRASAVSDRGGYRGIDVDVPRQSELLRRITSSDSAVRMPPAETGPPLTDAEIDTLWSWIEAGAQYERHWSFRPIFRPEVPATDSHWVRTPIDAFILRQLHDAGLAPSPDASRGTLIRRVHLDLLGLPPSAAESEAFLLDNSPDAFEQVVDRALASPHYGERWGRHWLDQARYADTNGYTVDSERSIWPYRDWVIRALNNDMPFDDFTIAQLAGDLLPHSTSEDLIATGFHRNTLVNEEGGTDDEQFRNEIVVDRVNTTGAVWLGLTLGCAQCHSHKFDPITQQEFYELFAFFNSSADVNTLEPLFAIATPESQAQLDALDRRIAATGKVGKDASADELSKLQQQRKQLADALPKTPVMRELDAPRETFVHIRGDFLRHGDLVHPDTPDVLPALAVREGERTPNRLDLARWLVSRDNPLTARVTVNRIWARYFGRGLVATENDFGLQGASPSHPELLDWLAAEIMDGGWSLKRLHRLILLSSVYRQSSTRRAELAADPRNELLGRQARLRVEAETVRDLALAASGLLTRKIGGPSVYPPQPAGVFTFTQRTNIEWPTSSGPDRYRRGLYTFFMRSAPYPLFTTFDAPNFSTVCTLRKRSNTPLQSLTLANDEVMIECARALGQHLREHAAHPSDRIELAFLRCLARRPELVELDRLRRFVVRQQADFAEAPDEAMQFAGEDDTNTAAEAAAWTAISRVMLNLDEFVTRE